tara:strand:+ start:199 stop:891 length:693 start_codon:yes stop_codon:yes gene_type:complete
MVENLFDLTEEEIKTSKMMYDGKVLKCLVAPYHSNKQLEEMLPYTPTTYLFPENSMSISQVKQFISMIVSNDKIVDEVRIITTNQNIIMDMVGECVRVLTEGGDIVNTHTKTFMANIHDIRYELLENGDHKRSVIEKEKSRDVIDDIITKINETTDNNTVMSKEEYDSMVTKIKIIGEPLIRGMLMDMASEIKVNVEGNSREELLVKAQEAVNAGDVETAKQLINQIERM